MERWTEGLTRRFQLDGNCFANTVTGATNESPETDHHSESSKDASGCHGTASKHDGSNTAKHHTNMASLRQWAMTMTMTVTMTHSYEVTNVNQEPGPTDMSAGVMTPYIEESDMSVRLAQRAKKTLGTLFKTVYRVTREKRIDKNLL